MAGMYGCFKGRNSDSAAMASGPPDATTNQEPAEVQEECSGKKKSKFQTFKKLFTRKKRKEPTAAGADAGLKASQSSDNVSKTSENNTLTRSEKEKGSGSKISLGSKALSHDSVFVSDSSEANEALGASQDSIHGKVKSLQLQLKQAIKLGSPPSLMCVKRTEDAGTMSEDDGLPCSPPEYMTRHTVMNQAQRNSSISLEGIDSDDDQLSCAASSRAVSPLVVPGDFSLPASPFVCLDNSAAKHKLGLRHKACNKRKPASRLDLKAEGDSVVEETVSASIPEAEALEKRQKTEDGNGDQLKPKVETEEKDDEEEEEGEENEQPLHSRQSQLRDKEEREEGEDESEAEQDVPLGLDTSGPPEPNLSEEEASDVQSPPTSKPSSRASSPDSPRATPEPPAGPREYLLNPPGDTCGAEENKTGRESASGEEEEEEEEEDGVQENRGGEEKEEGSLLQEVLSSLKTPLMSHSVDMETEGVVLNLKEEVEEKEKEEVETEELEELREEEAEVDEPVCHQAAPSCSVLSDQTTEEEEEVTASKEEEVEEEEVVAIEEEEKGREEELEEEQFTQHDHEEAEQEEEAVEVEPEEENDMFTRQTNHLAGEEEEEEEGEREVEAVELGKEPEVEEEEVWEQSEENNEEVEVEAKEERGEEEVMEGERGGAGETTEMIPEDDEVHISTSVQEADEGDDSVCTMKPAQEEEVLTGLGDHVMALVQEEGKYLDQNTGDERDEEEEEEEVEEAEEMQIAEQKSDREEDVEANQPDADQSEELEQEGVEVTVDSDMKQVGKDSGEATERPAIPPRPSPLSLPESHYEAHPQENEASSPSKTSTIHINLISPSSEKPTPSFQLPPTPADPSDSLTEPPPGDEESTEPNAAEDEEQADAEEEKLSSREQEAAPPAAVEETASKSPCSPDQSKVRFTVATAWQRSQSLSPPSSPPACDSLSSAVPAPRGEEVEAAPRKDPAVKAEPATSPTFELVLSPSRVRNAESVTAKSQSNAPGNPQIPAAANTEESSVVVEGNPDNPFGVRLRKTSALFRFSSEEENTEPPVESPTQPASCKVDSPQPASVKPSICQPISSKPALPKKPEVHGDKPKRISDPAAGRAVSAGSDSPSWISVAKQKQKIYKENSLDEITVKKEEQERKSSLPMYVSSAASREHGNKTVSQVELSKPSASVEKEAKRSLSPPAPVPPQHPKSHPLPCPIAPKPQIPSATAKLPPQPTPPQRSLSPPTPVPVTQKSPSCTSPTSLSKTATSPKTPPPIASPPFSSRTAPEKPASKAPGPSGQTTTSQRGMPPPALPQDEPPWMALAKKKAKAWSEMPQIVQ